MSFDLVINGKTVKANRGETLVDAGLSGWVAIPHDCNSGQCETCRVTVAGGRVDDRGTAEKGTVLACQAKVIGNAEVAFDHVPEVSKRSGGVTVGRRRVHDDGTAEKGTVPAGEAKVTDNADVAFDPVPEVSKRSGVVT